MQNNKLRNGLVLAIIVLFVGVSIAPCISGNISKISDIKDFETGTINDAIQIIKGKLHTMSTTDWWPMFRHDPNHTGNSSSTAPDTNNTIWSYTAGYSFDSSPSVANDKIYIGSNDHNVYCLDADTGTHIWNYTTGYPIHYSSPAVANGKVYIGSTDNKVYCLDADTGKYIWSYTTDDWIYSSPTVTDGKVYIGSHDNKVYCLDANTGTYIWSYITGDWIQSSPAVVDGNVYIGSLDDKVYCLDADTGTHFWNYTTDAEIQSSPAVADGKVYIGSRGGTMYCLDTDTGTHIWSLSSGAVSSSPAVANGKVYIGSWNGKVFCWDADTGTHIWSYTTGDAIHFSSPAVADGNVYIGSHDNKVYCLDADTGTHIWSYTTGSYVRSSPAVANGKVYIADFAGIIYAFSDENQPPNAPTIDGPTSGVPGIEYNYTFGSCDPEGDDIYYLINWSDGTVEDWSGPYPSCQIVEIGHKWSEPGIYYIRAKARDIHGAESDWSDPFEVAIGNKPPNVPTIDGPTSGKVGIEYEYNFSLSDPNEDKMHLRIDWGSGTPSKWYGPYDSDTIVKLNHTWSKKGTYSIRAQTQDSSGLLSDWGTLTVTMPRTRATVNSLFQLFFERFLLLVRLLNKLF